LCTPAVDVDVDVDVVIIFIKSVGVVNRCVDAVSWIYLMMPFRLEIECLCVRACVHVRVFMCAHVFVCMHEREKERG
jgi:hypothetical protein